MLRSDSRFGGETLKTVGDTGRSGFHSEDIDLTDNLQISIITRFEETKKDPSIPLIMEPLRGMYLLLSVTVHENVQCYANNNNVHTEGQYFMYNNHVTSHMRDQSCLSKRGTMLESVPSNIRVKHMWMPRIEQTFKQIISHKCRCHKHSHTWH